MEIQVLLKKLNETMFQSDIAEAVGSSQPSIHRWLHGKSRPSYSAGKALERLAEERGLTDDNKPNGQNP